MEEVNSFTEVIDVSWFGFEKDKKSSNHDQLE